jgi:hypothetical protein
MVSPLVWLRRRYRVGATIPLALAQPPIGTLLVVPHKLPQRFSTSPAQNGASGSPRNDDPPAGQPVAPPDYLGAERVTVFLDSFFQPAVVYPVAADPAGASDPSGLRVPSRSPHMSVKSKVADVVTALTTTGNKGLGTGLIERAQAANRESLETHVVNRVQEYLVSIQKQRDYIAASENNITLLRRRLEAIEAGEFTLNVYGNVMTFNDDALNKAQVRMPECVNCGFGARRDIDAVPSGRNRLD